MGAFDFLPDKIEKEKSAFSFMPDATKESTTPTNAFSFLPESTEQPESAFSFMPEKEKSVLSYAKDIVSTIPGAVKAGVTQIGVGAAGIGEAATQALGMESAEKWFDELGDDLQTFQAKSLPKDLDKNKAKYYTSAIFQNLATNLPMLAFGPVGALLGMGFVAAGSKFDEMDDKGYSTAQSILGGVGTGLIEAGTEMLPIGVLFSKMPMVKKAIGTAIADVIGEEAAEIGNTLLDAGFGEHISPAEFKQRLVDTFWISLGSGGLMGATVGTFEKMTGKQKAEITDNLKTKLQKPAASKETAAPIGGQRVFGKIMPDGTVATPEKIGNIRLTGFDANGVQVDRIENPGDISKILHMTYEANKQQIDEATRGKITNEETILMAHELGMTESQLLKRRKGQAFNNQEAYAARMVLQSSAAQLSNFMQEISANPSEQNIATFRMLMAKHAAIQAQVSGMTAEAGRTLQQFNIKAKGMQKNADLANKIVKEFGGKEVNAEVLRKAEEILSTGDMKTINHFFSQAAEVTNLDKLHEIWINSILSNPATHVANAISNTLTYISSIAERAVTPFAEGARAALIGQQRQRFFGETKAYVSGTINGFGDAMKVFRDVWKTGISQFGETKIEGRTELGAIKGKKGKFIRTPVRLLQAADDFAKTLVVRSELNALAYRQAKLEGLKGTAAQKRIQDLLSANPRTNKIVKEMHEKASYQAQYRTFTKALGVEKTMIQGLRKIPGMRYIVPFTRTPTNIAKYGIERTPLGFLKLFKQDFNKAEWADEVAAPLLGTTLMATAYALAKAGFITGNGPKDKNERDALYRTGWQPNAINMGRLLGKGDAWMRIDRLEPIASLFNMAADVAELQFDNDTDFSDVMGAAVYSITRNMTSKTFLSGLSNFLDAVSDPQRYGDNYIKMMAGSVVPGFIAGATRAIEPDLKITETPMEAIKERIPGLRDDLYSRRDLWGNIVERAGEGKTGIAMRYLFGTGISPVSNDPVDKEMVRLGVRIGPPTNKIKIPGIKEPVELTPSEYEQYQILAGKRAKELIRHIAKAKMSDELKIKRIKKAINSARKRARIRMYSQIRKRLK